MQGSPEIQKDFQQLKSEITRFAQDMANEVSKPPAGQSEVPGSFRQRSSRLSRDAIALGYAASRARIAMLQTASDSGARPSQYELHKLQDIQSHAVYIQSRLSHVLRMFERLLRGPSIPLYAEPLQEDDPTQTQLDILESALVALDLASNPIPQDAAADKLGCYSDIRLKPHDFVAHALAAYRVMLTLGHYGKARFLDVGCGGGGKLLLASHYFAKTDGIEFDRGYAASARRLVTDCGLRNSDIHQMNAMEFPSYADYEIVYFYQPMKDPEGLKELERIIVSSVRPGTILIAPYATFISRATELGFAHIDGRVFVAGVDDQKATRIRDAAMRTGIQIVSDIEDNRLNAVWRPARVAFAANGFCV